MTASLSRRLAFILAFVAGALLPGLAAGAGFDCSKAWNADEKRICASPQLSQLDDELNRAWRAAQAAVSGKERKRLADEQRQWLRARRERCTGTPPGIDRCLESHYRRRLDALQAYVAHDSGRDARHAGGELSILRMTPEGEDVPPGRRQVVFQFDRDVVAVGDMRRDAASLPVSITPAPGCEWRWLNARALACQLDEAHALKPATRYRVEFRPGLRTVDGAVMTTTWSAEFTTERPRVQRTDFVFWLTPQKPVLRVVFNTPVTKASALASLALQPPVPHLRAAFDLHPDDMTRIFPAWLSYPGLDEGQPEKPDDHFMKAGKDEARSLWLLVPREDLPADASVRLSVSAGLATPLGPERGVADDQLLQFDTLPVFRFLGISCWPNEPDPSATTWQEIDVDALRRGDAAGCDPLAPVQLRFSSPVRPRAVKDGVAFSPRLDGGRTDYDPWANTGDYTQRDNPHERGREYSVWLPELLKAAQVYRLDIGKDLRDEFGRALPAPLSLSFRTTHRDPRLVVDYRDVVLEKGVDSQATGYVTNVDGLQYRGVRIDAASHVAPVDVQQRVANIQDVSYRFALMVREILENKPGVTWLCVQSRPLSVERRDGHCLFAQVTPFAVHAKLGHFSSLAWVTDLATGEPVRGAKVDVVLGLRRDLAGLGDKVTARAAAVATDESGIAVLPGISVLDPALELLQGWDDRQPSLFVRVVRGEDIALLPLDWEYAVSPGGGIWSDLQRRGAHAHAWGFTAQGIHRAGDAVDAKLYLRDQADRHWIAPAVRTGYALRVTDPLGTVVFSRDAVSLDDFGAATFGFRLAPDAVSGWYDVELRFGAEQTWQPMRFLVSDFTPSPFRTESQLAGDLFAPGDRAAVTTRATFHAGGAYTKGAVRVRARVTGLPYQPGTTVTRGYTFGSDEAGQYATVELGEQSGALDADGAFRTEFAVNPSPVNYGRLEAESSVMDDRGKFVSARSAALYVARDRFVGVKSRRWIQDAGQPATFDLVVADPRGKLVGGAPVTLVMQRRVIRTARVQGPGDAFLLRNTGDWEAVGECRAESRADGAASCAVTPPSPGDYRVLATVRDTRDREYVSELWAWVVGAGEVNWAVDNDGGLEIVPESDSVATGQVARYLVKNPYPGARALVTVERYGILERRTQVFADSTAVVEVPVTADMAPGFYLSVVIASPRVQKPIAGEVDLGKPAFRAGYVKTTVTAPEKRLQVSIAPARMEYRPRDEVVAKLRATVARGARPQKISVAVVAIDEAVLALNAAGASYYDPLAGFDRLDSLDVGNWNLVARLAGRQKIEKKGANPGGDGGRAAPAALRDDFRYVALWQGEVKLDAGANGEVRFKAPDNLTGWRLLAVAVTPDDAFGLGEANLKVNRPTEIRPAMPNQVSQGDRFTARFTVMNRTKNARRIAVRVSATGADAKPLATTLALAPWEQQSVDLAVTTTSPGEVRFTASAGDTADSDALVHVVPVKARRAKEIAANYGTTDAPQAFDNLAIPSAIYPDSGALSVMLAPTVLGNLDGAFRYVKDYPYLCWEQRLSKAVMFASSKALKPWLSPKDLPADADARVRELLAGAGGFQAPNGGMTYWIAQDAYVSPYLSAYTALAFRWLARGGYEIPAEVQRRLDDYLRQMLRTDVMPGFYDAGMASSVRAVALAALADGGAVTRDEVLRYAPQLPRMSLFGKAHYLQALASSGAPAAETARAVDAILAMSAQSGGKFQFLEKLDDGYSELLATSLRDNCAALSALLRVAAQPGMAAKVNDIPFRLVRTITQSRGARDHFENTQENVFCTNALYGYARVYERTPPAMTVKARLERTPVAGRPPAASLPLGEARFNGVKDPAVVLRRALGAADAGFTGRVVLDRAGSGRLYYATRLEFAPKDAAATTANAGIEVTREYAVNRDGKWTPIAAGSALRRGELVRVDLFVKTPAARHYVVVDDPVPGLLEPVNTALATESSFDDEAAAWDRSARVWWLSNRDDWVTFGSYGHSFYHRELKHDAARFYADLLPAGNYHLAYTAQVIATGEFVAQAPFAGEMYDIDVFGRGLPALFSAREAGAGK